MPCLDVALVDESPLSPAVRWARAGIISRQVNPLTTPITAYSHGTPRPLSAGGISRVRVRDSCPRTRRMSPSRLRVTTGRAVLARLDDHLAGVTAGSSAALA